MTSVDGRIRSAERRHLSLLTPDNQQTIELCQFTSAINPAWEVHLLQDRLNRLSEGYRCLIDNVTDEQEKFELLVAYFFMREDFRILPAGKCNLRDTLLPQVLASKRGPSEILLLMFTAIARASGLKIQGLSKHSLYLLKVCISNRTHIVDFSRECHFLEPFEIVDLVNQGIDFSHPAEHNNSLLQYFYLVRKIARQELNVHIMTVTQSHLMRHQPFNLKHLSERAKLAYMSGDFRKAIDDIRDYFLFKSEEVTNFQLTRIYKLARKSEKSPPP